MANTDTPFGAKPIGHKLGLDWTQCVNVYYVSSSDSKAIGKYDLVSLAGSSDTLAEYPTVARAAAAGVLLGSVVGFGSTPYAAFNPSNLAYKYRPASTAMYLWVVDDPFVIYEMQEDNTANDMDADMVGLATDIATVADCNTTTGISTMELDSSDTATGAGQMRILGISKRPGNVLGTYCKWRVMINEHQLRAGTDV
jgi:hypothetical protein